MISVITRNDFWPIYIAGQTNNYQTCTLPAMTFWSSEVPNLVPRMSYTPMFPFCLWTAHICRVPIHMYEIKFGHFHSLIYLMSIQLLEQPKEPRKEEESFFLPHTSYF